MDPDLGWVERFGAVFEWNAVRAQELNRDFRFALRRKQIIPFKLPVSRFYRLFYLVTVVGVIMSIPILLTLTRQSYFESSSNLFAGFVLGTTAVGCAFWLHVLLNLRRARAADPYWVYTMIRVGVDRDILWIYKHHTISVFASREAFIGVKQIGNFVGAYVSPQTAHFFPIEVLRETENGQNVLDWFEKHWPNDVGRNRLAYNIPRKGRLRRLMRGLTWGLSALGLVILVISVVGTCVSLMMQFRNGHEDVTPPLPPSASGSTRDGGQDSPATDVRQGALPPALSGAGATKFIDRLARPGSK